VATYEQIGAKVRVPVSVLGNQRLSREPHHSYLGLRGVVIKRNPKAARTRSVGWISALSNLAKFS
jgi:hypothetical protein